MSIVVASPKVTVCVITYNHVKYVRDCLQSIVDQRTNFPFEVVIGDDCSTDGTQAIISEFASRYPAIIRPLLHAPHVGGALNFMHVYAAARGEYLAHLDGDDLMLEGKLQKQTDFLDARPECAFVAHKMYNMSEDGETRFGIAPSADKSEMSTVHDLIESYVFFAHSSKMVRRSVHFHHPRTEATVNTIDFTMHVEQATVGKIGFINETLGEYRKGSASALSSVTGDRLHRSIAATLRGYDRAIELGVDPTVVSRGRARYLFGAAMHCVKLKDDAGMVRYLNECVKCPKKSGLMSRLAFAIAWHPKFARFVIRLGLWMRDLKHKQPVTDRRIAQD